MSQENVEVVRGSFEAVRSRDWETVLAPYSPEVEWDDRDLRPEGSVHKGIDAMVAEMRPWLGTWDNYRQAVEQILDAGDQVVVVLREGGQGKGSRVAMDQRIGMVFTIEDRRIVRVTLYRHPSVALEAVGLRE